MFRKAALFLLVGLALNLTGCATLQRIPLVQRMALNHQKAKVDKKQRQYFENPGHDFIKDLQTSGLGEAEFIAQKIEYMLFDIVLSQAPETAADKAKLIDIFYGVVDSPEFPTAKDKFLGFIGSDELSQLILPKLRLEAGYTHLTDADMELVDSALLQHYHDKINGKSDPEGYAQGRLDLVLNNLPKP